MIRIAAVAMLAAISIGGNAGADIFTLEVKPSTVAWGNYDATKAPVLRIKSGDTVIVHTLLTNNPTGLERNGVKPEDVQQTLRDVYANVPQDQRGPGGHILTGPIFIEGAEPGDTLEIRIKKIDLDIPYAYNGFRYGAGILTDDFPYARTKIVPFDMKRKVALFAPGVEVPLRPFFGSMGVAPPKDFGRYDSTPPTIHGGNMDNKELVAGATLYLPIYNQGALFEVGDGHAAQGNGEVDVTALETSLVGTLEFVVRKDLHVTYPRAETPTHYIAMGFDDDLSIATTKAVREMVNFLAAEKKLSRDDAYMLTSVAGDLAITEIVDRNKAVHVMMPKAIFVK
jgi:acetamidase/formamidase